MSERARDRRWLVGTWVDSALVRRLDEQAAAADRSRSAEIRIALREHLDYQTSEQAKTQP